jgi:flagellar basal-body rod protein FlgC
MNVFKSMSISASGLTAQRLRMDVISQNIANADTTRTAGGTPYRRRAVVFQSRGQSFSAYLDKESAQAGGVRAASVVEDPSPLKRVYDPQHPDADQDGYVELPNVDTTKEMIDMISATRSYEANVTAFNASKAMALKALEIGR